MPAVKKDNYTQQLKKFKKNLLIKRKAAQPRLILIIMANTHDKTLSTACKKDAKAIQTTFKNICNHFNIEFHSIEVAGKYYMWDNVDKAMISIPQPEQNDVLLYYYTGHGFSYKNDRFNKYPQLDMRPHNKQVKFNAIDFIKNHTLNLEAVLNILRFRGARINIVIADCCNTTIPYNRSKLSNHDMSVSNDILPAKSKTLTKEKFMDDDNEVSILVASSQFGQPAITDSVVGSIFTTFFAKALSAVLHKKHTGEAYIPWVKILKKASAQAFKESKGYDIGGGVPGKQKAVFQVYLSSEADMEKKYDAINKAYEKSRQ
jgi:hypothetical protein